ncbi:MAG: hypothetical protein IJS08_10045 [Victivallales bacterium]|nr:hypothetical protein [Victivallales bacterium]
MKWMRRTAQATLTFKENCGAISSLCYRGHQVLQPSETLFLLKFKNGIGVSGDDFGRCSDDGETISFDGCGKYPGLEVEISVRGEGDVFHFRLRRLVMPEELVLIGYELPVLNIPDDFLVLDPVSDGRLISPEKRFDTSRNYDISEYWGHYPGLCQVQFIAAFNDYGGVRFFAKDTKCLPKRIMAYGRENCSLHIEVNDCGMDSYQGDFDFEVSPFEGDWMEAARPYRDWVFSSGVLKVRERPEWVRKSPVFITYVVRGEGSLSDECNCFVPYINALPHLMKIAEETDSVILAMIMRWDARGAWTPVAQWPPVGGEKSFIELVEALHERGHLVGLYGSGLSWTNYVYSNGMSCPPPPNEWLALQEDGSQREWDFKPFRRSVSLCLSVEDVRKYIIDEVLRIASSGIDLFQLYDQDFGGQTPHCFSCAHEHSPAPGGWQIQYGRVLQESLMTALREKGLHTVLGGESAAAEAYLNALQVNDLRTAPIGFVPLYSYIFHEITSDYSGNQCHYYNFDAVKRPENLLYRIALGFACGAMLTVPMRKNGEIDWGAGAPWTMPAPPRTEFLAFVQKLNAMRRQYPQFLLEGRMMPLREKLLVQKHSLFLAKGGEYQAPCVLATNWQSAAGEQILFLVNWTNNEANVEYGEKHIAMPARSVLAL